MELPNLMLASLAGYLVLGRFLVPRAKERWRADRTPEVVGKAMTVAVLTLLHTLTGAALAASVAVFVAVGVANREPPGDGQ
jgi:hypothetical protein